MSDLAVAEFLTLLDERVDVDGQVYPTLDDYTRALEELHAREADHTDASPITRASILPVRQSMNTDAKPWTVGDPSPASGAEMVHYRPATAAEWAAFTHKENPHALPPRVDSASPEFIAEHGELYVDEQSGYRSRVQPAAADAGAADDAPRRRARDRHAAGSSKD